MANKTVSERLAEMRENASTGNTYKKAALTDAEVAASRMTALRERVSAIREEKATARPVQTGKYQRQQMEEELEQLRKSYTPGGAFGGRTQEDKDTLRRIQYLENQLRRDESEAYYEGVLERMSELDEETVGYLDQLREGMPETPENMQGIADNRSWEEIYAEQQAWDETVRRMLREKGYDDSQIAQMADDRTRQVNRENFEREVAASQEEAEEHPFWASVKSVPQNLTGGLGTLSLAGQNAHKALTGDDRPVDYYTPEMVGQAKAQAARQTVSQNLEENTELSTKLTGNVASFLYNTGMSMTDSAAVAGMTMLGVPPAVGTTLLGGSAATQAAREAKERGVSDAQALFTGLAAGAAESFFEKYSLGNLLEMKPARGVLTERVLGNLKNIGIQAGVEGSEELATSLANAMTDAIINGDKNAYTQSVYDYMAQGMTYEDATKAATGEFVRSLAQDFLGGALSGGTMGGFRSGTQTALETRAIGRQLKGAEHTLIDERRAQKAGDQAAQRMQEKMEDKFYITDSQRRELFERTLRQQNREVETAQAEAAAARLRELGEDGDVEKIARAAVKSAAGNENGAQRVLRGERALRESTYGAQVAQELRDGADWTQQLPKTITRSAELERVQQKAINPAATDEREVVGTQYNPKTRQMDATVKGEGGVEEAVPMASARVTMQTLMLADVAAVYGEAGPTMMAAIRPEQSPTTYARQWNTAYEYALGGMTEQQVMKSRVLGDLTEEQKRLAWQAGNEAAKKKTAQNAKERAERTKPKEKKAGTVSLKGATIDGVRYAGVEKRGLTPKQRASISVMRVLAQETGVNVVFYESLATERGRIGANGVYQDGTIYLDIAAGVDSLDLAQAAVLRTAAHELTHYIQDMDEEAYNKVKDFVLAKLSEREGVSLETLIQNQIGRSRGELSHDEAIDEVVADACEMMLKDSAVLEELARQDQTLAEKIVEFLKKLMQRLQKAFEGVEARSAEAKAMAEYTQELQQIWDEALRSAIDGGATKNTAETGGVAQYSIREAFASEVDAWDKNGRIDGERFVLGSTGPVMQGLGAIESDIYMNAGKINAILRDHPEMTLDEIKRIPQMLEDPVLVLKSKGKNQRGTNSRVVIFGSLRTTDGRPVLAVMDLRPTENGFTLDDMQKVNSAYAKKNPAEFIRQSEVLYADKKRTIPLLRQTGLTITSQQLLQNGYIGSITYRGKEVNLSGEPFSAVVSEKKGKKSARDSEYTAAVKAGNMEAEQRFDESQSDIRYSLRDTEITDREILAATLDSAAQNEGERSTLEVYRGYAIGLEELEKKLAIQRQKIQDHERPAGDPQRIELSPMVLTQVRNRAAYYAREIDKKQKYLKVLERQKALQDVLARERAYIEEQLNGDMEAHKARYAPSLERKLAQEWSKAQYWRKQYEAAVERNPGGMKMSKRAQKAKLRKNIEQSAKRLMDLLVTNTDKKHVPEDLKEPLGEFLTALDLSSTRLLSGRPGTKKDADYAAKLTRLKEVLDSRVSATTNGGTISGYLDLPTGFAERLQDHIEEARKAMEQLGEGETVVNRLSLEQLEELNMILNVLKRSIETVNELMANRRFADVEKAAVADMAHLREIGKGGGDATTATGKAEGFLSWTNLLPVYAFRKLGKGAQSIFESMQDGWDKLARNAKMVMEFTEKTYTPEEAKAWSEEIHEVELYDPDVGEYTTVYLTTAQIMSLWALSQRQQAYSHIVGDPDHMGMGIRPEDIVLPKTLKRPAGKTIRQDTHFRVGEREIQSITNRLTARQLEVAKALQKFMEQQGSAWGNEVSMQRHGYNFFGEKNYFPIETDREDRPARNTEQGSETDMYRLLNLSSTKALTRGARNAVIVRNIFDVYSNHMADMAKYNALALPLLDAIKWYNWSQNPAGVGSAVEGAGDTTMKRAITKAYGKAANEYIVQFIRDMNGVKEGGGRGEDLPKRMISNYKRSSVAANLRVAFLQPTSYVRAGAVIEPKYLLSAAKEKTRIGDAAKEMREYSGIALWKSMGFFDTDVGRSMREQIKGTQSKLEKWIDKSMILAEKGDEITWAMLWKACKAEQSDKGLNGEELMKATAERFREVIYTTQVVDSTMTRSGLMRGTSTFNKMATSFMSEPTVSYNMVMQAVDAVREDMRKGKGMNAHMAIKKNARLIQIVFTTYVATEVASALIESIMDAWRDDDDEPYLDKVLEALSGWDGNLIGNLNPLNKIPYVKDVVSLIEGYDTGRMDTQGLATAWKSIRQLWETFAVATGLQEKPTKITNYGNATAYGLIYQTAKGLSQFFGIPVSNALREVQAAWNNLMQSAGWDGLKWKTYENVDETSARNMYEAMQADDKTAWAKERDKWQKRLMKEGAPEREALSTVRGGVKSMLKEDYYTGSMEAAEAEQYLTVWLGMQADDAKALRLEWDCYVETGIKFGDIRSLYETDEIDRAEVLRLRMKYGQETRAEAEAKAKWYDWGKEYPGYADLSEKKAGGWYDYVARSGMSAERYYQIAMDAAEQGANSKAKLVAFVRKQGLPASQQRALWYALKNSSWKNDGTPWA